MRSLMVVLLSIVLTLVPTLLVAGEVVSDQRLGLRLSIPDGFVPFPQGVEGDVLFAFQHPPAVDQKLGSFIRVSRLHGTLGRDKMDPKVIAAKSPQVTILPEQWKTFEIEVFRVPEQLKGLQVLTFNAQVPLKPEAVQVTVLGEETQENELREVLRSVLASLEGQSNWLTWEERGQRFGEGIGKLLLTILVVAVIVEVVRRSNRKKKVNGGGAKPTIERPRE
jgi:hypothetical protein